MIANPFSQFFRWKNMNDVMLDFVNCTDPAGGHRMAYWQWGDALSAHVVVCVHGLSRQGRDFDVLAQVLCDSARQQQRTIRVICPDVVGRGESDWLKDPMGYQVPAYAGDILALLAQLQARSPIQTLDWVGTSMGGLIGMVVCGSAASWPSDLGVPVVRRLVLNDIGPAIEWQSIVRIGTFLGQAGHFDTEAQAADAMLAVSQGFGPHTPAQWLALSRPMLRRVNSDANSPLRLHYDPAIAGPFKLATEESTRQSEAVLWQLYDQISAQTLLLRGAHSDLLSADTARAMTQRGPRARLVEFEGVGHAPTMVAADQVDTVTRFLLG
jgi:pimeloyl-ACP methyl ester carboxylesterase